MDEDDADSPESEKDDEVGGVWIVGNLEELADEKMICDCRERREVEQSIDRSGCRCEHWTQVREDQRDGCNGDDANRRDGFSIIRAVGAVEIEMG